MSGGGPASAFPPLAVARAGLAAFARLCADRHAAAGIRIDTLPPGPISSLPHPSERAAEVPMGRIGRVTEVAATVAFRLSGGARCMTRESLRVDGGMKRSR